jgi:8-amino-7-oxononanoate synthase
MSSPFEAVLEQRLLKRENQGLKRLRFTRETRTNRVCFSSNDYLGLASETRLHQAFQEGIARYGFGSGASPLVSGYSYAHQACEEAFSAYRNRDRSLLFANGYLANLALIQGLFDEQSTLFYDRANHASLYDGAKLSSATLVRYRSEDLYPSPMKGLELGRDIPALSRQIEASSSPLKAIVTESIFSTDGRSAPLPALIELQHQHQVPLIVDDAHGFGLYPLTDSALDLPIIVTPLGKALGGFGGIISGSQTVIETIIQCARNYLFSTAPPPALAHALTAGLALMQQESWRREKLFENVAYFKATAQELGLTFKPSQHPIQSLVLQDPFRVVELKTQLLEKGFDVTVMRPPTVPPNQSLLRVTLTALHSPVEILHFLETLRSLTHE